MDWITIVQSLGFPIACVAALGWFVVRLTDQHKAEMDAWISSASSPSLKHPCATPRS